MIGILYFDDRDVQTDFGLIVTEFSGWPGMLGSAQRDVPLIDGPEMSGAIFDPRLVRRRSATATVKGVISGASVAAALTYLDNLRNLVLTAGEIPVRSAYAPTRQCIAACTGFDGNPQVAGSLDGKAEIALTFVVRSGTAEAVTPDGYALSTVAVAMPIGTAPSKPVIVVHGNGATLTNPVVTIRDSSGAVVQTMGFTVVLGATQELWIDCARTTLSFITAGAVTDAMNVWTSGDFPQVRPYDGNIETAAYPTIALSASAGTPVGTITYTRQYV